MRTDNDSRYGMMAAELRDDILRGRLPPGDKMPSERDLCERFDASRVTVRRALRLLEDERLIVRRHGSGTYVGAQPARRIPLMIDYTGSMRDYAPSLQRRVLTWRWDKAPAAVADDLRIEENDDVLYVERQDTLDGKPVAWDSGTIVAAYAEGLNENHLAQVSFLETWAKVGRFGIESCRQTIEAAAADALTHRRLGIQRGKPVLKSTELYLTDSNKPAGLFVSFYHPSHICISSHYRWSEATRHKTETKGLGHA